jgi:hypothetical protein
MSEGALGILLGAGLVTVAFGCSKVSEASADRAAPAAAAAAGPTADGPNYAVQIALAGPCHKGQPCTADVTIQAKGDYHMNDKYPYKFKVQDPAAEGVKYSKAVVTKDDGVFEEKKGVMKVPFVAESSGDKKIGGTLSFSVCSAQNCLMDKQVLETTVKVD